MAPTHYFIKNGESQDIYNKVVITLDKIELNHNKISKAAL